MRIVSEQVDQIEQGLQNILANHGTDMKAVKVKYMLTGTTAKLEIRMDGQPETTNEQIQRIYQALTSFYNPS
jgi:putative lipoic acid-binding regulatory protein